MAPFLASAAPLSLHSSWVNFHGSRLVAFHPDPTFHSDADLDPASQNDADPDPQHCLENWRQTTRYKIFEPSFQLHFFEFLHWLFYSFLDLDHGHTLLIQWTSRGPNFWIWCVSISGNYYCGFWSACRISMLLGLPDLDPSLFCMDQDPDLDPSINK